MGFWDIVLEAKKSSTQQPINEKPSPEKEKEKEEIPEDNKENSTPEDAEPANEETPEEGNEPLEVNAEPSSEEGGDNQVDDFSSDIETGDEGSEDTTSEEAPDDFDSEVMNSEEGNGEGEMDPEGGEVPAEGDGENPDGEAPPEGEDGDPATDNNLEDEQKDNDTVTREYNLLCDFEELYDLVTNCIGVVTSSPTNNLVIKQILTTCERNFRDIGDRINRYVHFNFKHKSYVENLTIYNYLVQSVKITIEMLKNVKNLANI